MKIVFMLDNQEYVEVVPEKLQIRQIQEGVAALGTEVTVPVLKEDKTPETNEDGSPKTQVAFRPFINYSVTLQIPPVAAAGTPTPALPAPEVQAIPEPALDAQPREKLRAKRQSAKLAE
jgi:hypothetical protein